MTKVTPTSSAGWPDLSDAKSIATLTPKTTQSNKVLAYGLRRELFQSAELEHVPSQPRMAVSGDRAVVIWAGPLWKELGTRGALLCERDSQYVPVDKLPACLAKDLVAVAGPGYLMLVPLAEAPSLEQAIKLRRQARLVDKTLISVDGPLPREKALGFKQYQVCPIPHKASHFVDVGGNIWEAIGVKIGDPIEVTRFLDGVRITKAKEGERKLASKRNKEGVLYGHKRLGETIFRGLVTDTARVAFTKDALLLLGDDIKLAEFGLTAKQLYVGTIPVKEGALDTTPTRSVVNFSVYPLNRKASRVQVQGDWLTRYGFAPGVKFTLEPHPLVRGRVLVRVDPEGTATVTKHSRPGSSKLYIPTKMLEHFNSPDVRVWGNVEGLHVQQHFATSWTK